MTVNVTYKRATDCVKGVNGMGDVKPSVGLGVLHLFCAYSAEVDVDMVTKVATNALNCGVQVVPVALLGHKADIALMCLSDDLWQLRDIQTGLQHAGLQIVDSYLSMTEISEYAQGVPDEAKNARLYPQLPPDGKRAWCFYPMSKKREAHANWFSLPFDERKDLMHEHGVSGRKFAGRIVQLITASTGLDDFEWGVTLFGVHLDDLKDVVYTMRFDQASAVYADFGVFYTGLVCTIDELLSRTS